MEKIDCAIIGAGVIGLAVARQLAAQGREVLILEAEGAFGTGISARNSEVIHAGIDYTVAPERADAFYAEVRRYWPQLPDGALQPAYAGIRPKPHAPDEAACDFLVSGPAEHGIRGLVCLYGIESPGLTACLALADHVAATLTAAPSC